MGALIQVRCGDDWIPFEVPNDAVVFLTAVPAEAGRVAEQMTSRPMNGRPFVSIDLSAISYREQPPSPPTSGVEAYYELPSSAAEPKMPSSSQSNSRDRG